jgi:hypothetical protein
MRINFAGVQASALVDLPSMLAIKYFINNKNHNYKIHILSSSKLILNKIGILLL